MASSPTYRYDTARGRYRDNRGRFIAERTVRGWVHKAMDQAIGRATMQAQALRDGKLSLGEFQRDWMAEIKQAHLAAAMAAHGGRAQMTASDWGWVGQRIKAQYQYLRGWAAEIAAGTAPVDGRMTTRAQMYGNAPVATYEAMKARDARASGKLLEERNHLDPAARHCSECPGLSSRGWVPLGTLPQVGSRQCRSRDRCTIERREMVDRRQVDVASRVARIG